MPWAHGKVYPSSVVYGAGGTVVISRFEPSGVEFERSVRTNFARRIAPSTLSSPVPCSSMLYPASGWAVYIRIILTRLGVSFGFACNNNEAAPETSGVAIEVPLIRIIL